MRLVALDIDGTLAQPAGEPWPNMVSVVAQQLARPDTELVFCTARPKSEAQRSWAWLNQHLRLNSSGKRCLLVCRPDDVAERNTAHFKLFEMVRAVRRYKPSELTIYDSDVRNLRLFGTLQKVTPNLALYRVEDGVATRWTL